MTSPAQQGPYTIEWSGENRTARVLGPAFTGSWQKESTAIHRCADMNAAYLAGQSSPGAQGAEEAAALVDRKQLTAGAKERWQQLVERGEFGPHPATEDPWRSFNTGWLEGRIALMEFIKPKLEKLAGANWQASRRTGHQIDFWRILAQTNHQWKRSSQRSRSTSGPPSTQATTCGR